jgi:phospholipid transport system substrate-binding protein
MASPGSTVCTRFGGCGAAGAAGRARLGHRALGFAATIAGVLLFAAAMVGPSAALFAAAMVGPSAAAADDGPRPASAPANAAPAAAASDPTAFVKAVIDQASAVVRDTAIPVAERNRKLRAVAEANFDFTNMARTALGYHWRELTPEQRAQFIPVFTKFMENVYLSKMQDYGVARIRQDISTTNVSFTGQESQDADYAEVHSKAVLKDRPQPVKVDYLLKREAGGWKIYDLDVDAISVMANYRNQFNRVINDDGYPALLSLLHKKTQALEQTLNK